MVVQSGCSCFFFFISPVVLLVLFTLLGRSFGLQYMVGDSVWSIPPNKDFYTNWSSAHSFQIGDSLVFDFDSELHDVMQVSGRDYETCNTNHPLKTFTVGPAIVPLIEQGVFYFTCSVSNYCGLGQKLVVVVLRRRPTNSAPTSLPTPPSASQYLAPNRPQPLGRDAGGAAASPPVGNTFSSQASMAMSVLWTRSAGICDINAVLIGWASALCLATFLVLNWVEWSL